MLAVIDGRNGKTSVAAELIRSLADAHWSALKISGGLMGVPAAPRIHQEQVANARTDSGRMLAAGAERSYDVISPDGDLDELLPELKKVLASSSNAIIETNRLLRVVDADLYLYLIDVCAPHWREEVQQVSGRVDAFLALDRGCEAQVPAQLGGKPVYCVGPGCAIPAELLALVQSKM